MVNPQVYCCVCDAASCGPLLAGYHLSVACVVPLVVIVRDVHSPVLRPPQRSRVGPLAVKAVVAQRVSCPIFGQQKGRHPHPGILRVRMPPQLSRKALRSQNFRSSCELLHEVSATLPIHDRLQRRFAVQVIPVNALLNRVAREHFPDQNLVYTR